MTMQYRRRDNAEMEKKKGVSRLDVSGKGKTKGLS